MLFLQQISYVRQTKQLPNHEVICKPREAPRNQQLSPSKTLSKSQQVLRIDSNASCQMSDECASVIQTYSQQVPTILPHSIWFSILITLILIRNKSSATYFTNRMFLLQSTLWSDQSSCHSYHRGPISKGHMESVQGYKSMGHLDETLL